tara:strand:- start:423 stop:611 length:189 start_codon:yes stop_codon:yes gene_type:complete
LGQRLVQLNTEVVHAISKNGYHPEMILSFEYNKYYCASVRESLMEAVKAATLKPEWSDSHWI